MKTRSGDAGGNEQPAGGDRRRDGRGARPDRLIRPISRNGATFPARCSTGAASWWRRRRISRSISGSTPLSVRAAIERLNWRPATSRWSTIRSRAAPICRTSRWWRRFSCDGERAPFAYAANRAHHADIGGMAPGSMALATEIYQEGFRLPPVKLMVGGKPARDVFELFFANTRVREEREGDLRAQVGRAAGRRRRVRGLVAAVGRAQVAAAMEALKDYADRLMRAALAKISTQGPTERAIISTTTVLAPGRSDCASRSGSAAAARRVDFTGSAPQVRGSVNANYAITLSATFYVMKCLAAEAVPANEGLMRPIKLIAPPGTIVNACARRGRGRQRRNLAADRRRAVPGAGPGRARADCRPPVPARCRTLRWAATMLFARAIFPITKRSRVAPARRRAIRARPGIHTHMTNTLNTPIEALEAYYPMRMTEYRDPARFGRARANSTAATAWCASSNAWWSPTSAC